MPLALAFAIKSRIVATGLVHLLAIEIRQPRLYPPSGNQQQDRLRLSLPWHPLPSTGAVEIRQPPFNAPLVAVHDRNQRPSSRIGAKVAEFARKTLSNKLLAGTSPLGRLLDPEAAEPPPHLPEEPPHEDLVLRVLAHENDTDVSGQRAQPLATHSESFIPPSKPAVSGLRAVTTPDSSRANSNPRSPPR